MRVAASPDAMQHKRTRLTQICAAWVLLASLSARVAVGQLDEQPDLDAEVEVFLPSLAKKLAKRSTTRRPRETTPQSEAPDPGRAGQLAVVPVYVQGGGRRRQQQRRRNQNNQNWNNNNNNNWNSNNNILNSNPGVMNGTVQNTGQRRNNQRRRQQQLGIFVSGQNRRKPNFQVLRPARQNRRRQNMRNGQRRNNRRQNNRNNNNNLGVFGGQQQQQWPASKLPIAYPEPSYLNPGPFNNMNPNPSGNMNPNANPYSNQNYPPPNPPPPGSVYPYSAENNPVVSQTNWPPAVIMPVKVEPTYPEGTQPPLPPATQSVSETMQPVSGAETHRPQPEY